MTRDTESVWKQDFRTPLSLYDFNAVQGKTCAGTPKIFNSIRQCKYYKGSWTFPPLKLSGLFGIARVYAEGPSETNKNSSSNNSDEATATSSTSAPSFGGIRLEELAHLYISKESGWDRVKSIFEKDHRGKSSQELNVLSVALVQVFVITFFCKYIPVAKFARKEFIREHQATVFRTRIEAIRRMNDQMFTKAAYEAGWMSVRVTSFSTSFLFLSQMISSYRNKTSVVEYTVASAITGGVARISLGLRGFVAGSLVGGLFGSAIGLIAFSLLSAYNLTTQERHLSDVIDKLEVERSIVGDAGFHQKVNEITQEIQQPLSEPSPS